MNSSPWARSGLTTFDRLLLCSSDDTDLTVSLEHCQQDIAYFGDVPIEAQVLEDVMFAQTIAVCGCFVERSIPDDYVAAAFDQEADRVGSP